MENKTLETLNDELFRLPKASMLQISGGLRQAPTRIIIWTVHGEHEDIDAYELDTHDSPSPTQM